MNRWWVIYGGVLMDALKRCRAGEDPDLVYTELFANSQVEEVGGEPDDHPV